jgi:hypothetical protein
MWSTTLKPFRTTLQSLEFLFCCFTVDGFGSPFKVLLSLTAPYPVCLRVSHFKGVSDLGDLRSLQQSTALGTDDARVLQYPRYPELSISFAVFP